MSNQIEPEQIIAPLKLAYRPKSGPDGLPKKSLFINTKQLADEVDEDSNSSLDKCEPGKIFQLVNPIVKTEKSDPKPLTFME